MNRNKYFHTYQQEHVQSKKVDFNLFKRLWGYLKPYKIYIFISIAVLVIAKAFEIAIPVLIGSVTQQIFDHAHLSQEAKDAFVVNLVKSALLIFVLLIMIYGMDALNIFLRGWIGQKALYHLRSDVYRHIQQMPLNYYDHHMVGRLMTRTIHDVDQINLLFSESVVPIVGNLLLFSGIFLALLILDWRLGLAIFFLMPLVFWATHRFRTIQRQCYELVRSIVSAMNTFVQENLMGGATIRNFGLQKREKKRFDEINQDFCQANVDSIENFSFFSASIDFLQNLSLIVVFALLAYFSSQGEEFQAGLFFTFSLFSMMFFRPLADLAEKYNVFQSAMAASDRIFHILDQSTEKMEEGESVLSGIESILFEDVWFAYEGENWVLKGVSFEIKSKESIALVGTTGSGKTTLLSLLLRFYEFQKGTIKINGTDIRKYPLNQLRKQFSVVLQDPVIFSGTILENITLYDNEISLQKVEDLISDLGMQEMVERFSKRLEHSLNERGKDLSAGERQLISLARAVLHPYSVLILDEATANIDSHTEKIIQEALKLILRKKNRQKTSLIVAHRLSTIKDVSRIIVLHQGKVIESGNHAELLLKQGVYEKLFRLQFE
jgi:ATP-binding cassette, subfamily B, multidrug efflux pump